MVPPSIRTELLGGAPGRPPPLCCWLCSEQRKPLRWRGFPNASLSFPQTSRDIKMRQLVSFTIPLVALLTLGKESHQTDLCGMKMQTKIMGLSPVITLVSTTSLITHKKLCEAHNTEASTGMQGHEKHTPFLCVYWSSDTGRRLQSRSSWCNLEGWRGQNKRILLDKHHT